MLRAAAGPWCSAFAQCSTRIALAVERVLDVRDVAGGEHVRRARPQQLVDEDAVVDGEAGLLGEARARLHADADDDEVAVERLPVGGAHALDRARALEGLDAGPEQHPHAVVGVDVAVDGAELGPQHALQRHRGGSTTVTSRPRWRADAATSAPIQPAPTTTTEPPRSSRARSASESSTLRR